jgi:hypothetical protein
VTLHSAAVASARVGNAIKAGILKHEDSAARCGREALRKDAFVPDKSRRISKWLPRLPLALAQTWLARISLLCHQTVWRDW